MKELQLTKIDPLTLLDIDTYDVFVSGELTKETIEYNIKVYADAEFIQCNSVPFAITKHEKRKFLHPFKMTVGTKQYRYAFLIYFHESQELHWFFKGIAKTKDRAEAFKIYDALLVYCNDQYKARPFSLAMIKR